MALKIYLLIAAFLSGPALARPSAMQPDASQGVLLAQFNRPLPPADIPQDDGPAIGGSVIVAQDSSSLLLRIDRLENQIRSMTGQIEQMQFQQRKLEEGMRRLQDAPQANASDPALKPAARTPGIRRPNSSDAFDPSANLNAPGAPRPLGQPYGLPQGQTPATTPQPAAPPRVAYPQGPIALEPDEANKPLDLNNAAPRAPADISGNAPPRIIPLTPATPAGQPAPLNGEAVPPTKPLSEYDVGVNLYRQGQYASAETTLNGFLQKNPRDRYVPDAVFYLGETFFQRQRHREAAEQYLKLSTDYSKSARAPDALVRLGMSLNAMGAKEQACATFGEVGRKYPDARAAVRGADRESKKAQC